MDHITLICCQQYLDIDTITQDQQKMDDNDPAARWCPGFKSAVGESWIETFKNGYMEISDAREGGWYCSFCSRYVRDPAEHEDIPEDDDKTFALERYFKHYEDLKAPLDRNDKQLLRNMVPDICPYCYRFTDNDERDAVIFEIVSYWLFVLFLMIPMTIIFYPFYTIGKVQEFLSKPFEDMMNKPVKEDAEDTKLMMPRESLLKKDFGSQAKYKSMFQADNSIWQLVEDNLGKHVEFRLENAMELAGEMTRDKEENTALSLGFNVNDSLTVISVTEGTAAAEAGVKAQDKVIAIRSKPELGKIIERTNKEKNQLFIDELRSPTKWPLIVTFAPLEEGVVKYEIVGAFEDYPFEEVLNYFPWVPKYEVLEDADGGGYHRNCEIRTDFPRDDEDVDDQGRKPNKDGDSNDMDGTYGWGEEIASEEVSKLIPEPFQDKFKFPNYDPNFFD